MSEQALCGYAQRCELEQQFVTETIGKLVVQISGTCLEVPRQKNTRTFEADQSVIFEHSHIRDNRKGPSL